MKKRILIALINYLLELLVVAAIALGLYYILTSLNINHLITLIILMVYGVAYGVFAKKVSQWLKFLHFRLK